MELMKITQRIPTSSYAYIEFEGDYETPEEALTENVRLVGIYEDEGLPMREWAQLRNKMFKTGEFDPNIEGLSKAQRYFINECKKAYRAITEDGEISN